MNDLSGCPGNGLQAAGAKVGAAVPPVRTALDSAPAKTGLASRWRPWIFAAKTTASALLALLVAFTFNLDQPKWCVLTVYIVAQPQSGLVLAKSFYRIIGTLVGAAVALVLVALFAQERVLFLGSLAIWIAICTFTSKRARNFTSYAFVLSGYTVAIVGIPGALAPDNAFYIAVARVTEISLGIIAAAVISHLVLPVSLADDLRSAIAAGRTELADYATALLFGNSPASSRVRLLDRVIAIENLRASAVFEDCDIRGRNDAIQRLGITMFGLLGVADLLDRSLPGIAMAVAATDIRLDEALITAGTAIGLWRDGELDASRLRQRLLGVGAGFPQVGDLGRAPSTSDEEVINRAGIAGRLQEFCAAFVAFAEAHEAFLSPRPRSIGRARFVPSNDLADAMWAGLRPAMALAFVGTFWILADWASPAGWTATILAPLVTARLATMENATKAALAGTILVALATLPYFIVVEVLLPLASGFPMFALAVAPVLFFCAFLMGTARTAGLGFVAGLYFAYSAQFLDRMAYDPVAFVNTSIAIILAIAASWLLFAIVAPESPQAARRRFVRVARKAFQRIAHGRPTITLAAFETGMTEALVQLQRDLEPEPADRIAAVEAGVALMSAGRELIQVRDAEPPTQVAPDIAEGVARFLAANERRPLDRATRTALDASLACLTELRNDRLGVADTQAVTQKMVALGAIRDELKRAGEFTSAGRAHTVLGHVD